MGPGMGHGMGQGMGHGMGPGMGMMPRYVEEMGGHHDVTAAAPWNRRCWRDGDEGQACTHKGVSDSSLSHSREYRLPNWSRA